MMASSTDREREEGELTDDDEGFVTVVRRKPKHTSHANNSYNKYRKGGGNYSGYNNNHNAAGADSEAGREFKTTKSRRNFRYGDRRKDDQKGGRRYQEDRDRDKPETESTEAIEATEEKATQDKQTVLPSTTIIPTIRRAFSEVTKSSIRATGANNGDSSSNSTRATRGVQTLLEDWPSLQETVVSTPSKTTPSSTGTVSPSIAQSKPVISTIATVTEKLGKIELRESVINNTTKSLTTDAAVSNGSSGEGKTLQKLPEDKWPSISDAVTSSNGGDDVRSLQQATYISPSPPAQRNNAAEKEEGEITDSDDEGTGPVNKVAGGKINGFELPLTPTKEDNNHKMSDNGSLCSSSETTGEHELDLDSSTGGGSGKKMRKNKQKWVPLQLPETPSAKSTRKKERSSAEKDVDKEINKDQTNNHSSTHREKNNKGKMHANNKDGVESAMNAEGAKGNNNQSNSHVYAPRGRGRHTGGGGNRGRGDKRLGRAAYQNNWVNYNGGLLIGATSPDLKGDEYADYPADYTTLPPMYPVTEFIMPYLFTPVFTPQPSGTLIDETQIASSAFVPVDDGVLLDMIRKQIEYYFSEENLQKDFYLRRKMTKDGFLPVTFIATFPRIKTMTQDFNVLIQAMQSSPELEMNKDLTCVRRVQDPNKWPIADEVSLVKAKSTRHKPATLNLHYSPPQNVLTYPTNGYIALSPPLTADSTLNNNNSTPFLSHINSGITDKLNPNVPEFVPKSKLMETKS